MKRVLLVLVVMAFGLSTFAQSTAQDTTQVTAQVTAQVKSKVSISPYVATGLSIGGDTTFMVGSYFSVEAGVMIENLMIGLVFGVNNLNSFGSIQNYWYEGKVAYAITVKIIDIYGVVGIGSYTGDTKRVFLEYGGGVSKSFDNGLGVFIQATSWDNAMYVTPGLFYSF